MKILSYALGQLQANCYFLIEGDECLIIDPADEAPFILEELQRKKLKLVAMLVTHGHFDHLMATGEIQMVLKETSQKNTPTLFIDKNDLFLVRRINETARYFLGHSPSIIRITSIKHLIEGKNKIGIFEFDLIPAPGHTPGSSCFYFKKDNVIFTGDTLFKEGVGRYDFSYSNKEDLRKSLEKLLHLPKSVRVYPGHGKETTIGDVGDFLKTHPIWVNR